MAARPGWKKPTAQDAPDGSKGSDVPDLQIRLSQRTIQETEAALKRFQAAVGSGSKAR